MTPPDIQHPCTLIGAFRDNQVTPTHPLMRTLEAIRQTAGDSAEIALAPLSRAAVSGS